MSLAFTVVSGQSVIKVLRRPWCRHLVLRSPMALIKRTTKAGDELQGLELLAF